MQLNIKISDKDNCHNLKGPREPMCWLTVQTHYILATNQSLQYNVYILKKAVDMCKCVDSFLSSAGIVQLIK